MSSPWNKIIIPEPTNFKDIVSEELTIKLIEACLKENNREAFSEVLNEKEDINTSSCSSDANSLNIDFINDSESEDFNDAIEDLDEYDTVLRDHCIGRPNIQKIGHKPISQPLNFNPVNNGESDMEILRTKDTMYKKYGLQKWIMQDYFQDRNGDSKMTVRNLDVALTKQLFTLINRKIIERINYTISSTDTMLVLHVSMGPKYKCQKECVVKLYKPMLTEENKHSQKRKVKETLPLHPDAQKELSLLKRLCEAKIPCREIVHMQTNILITTFIGSDYKAAPLVKYAILNEKEKLAAYNQVFKCTKDLYAKCNLVYRDLSAKDILWHNSACHFTNINKMVETSHENALNWLYQSCQNINKIFKKHNIPKISTANKIFDQITGFTFKNKLALKELQDRNKLDDENMQKFLRYPGKDAVAIEE